MARVILTNGGEDVVVGGSNVEVIGTAVAGEVITVFSGNVTLNSSFTLGGDTIRLPGDASDYTVRAQGARIIFENATDGVTVIIPTSDLANTVTFSNGADARSLRFDSVDGRFELDGVAIGTTPAPVVADTALLVDGETLVMASGHGANAFLTDAPLPPTSGEAGSSPTFFAEAPSLPFALPTVGADLA